MRHNESLSIQKQPEKGESEPLVSDSTAHSEVAQDQGDVAWSLPYNVRVMKVYVNLLGLLLGTEAPVITPNGADFSFFSFFLCEIVLSTATGPIAQALACSCTADAYTAAASQSPAMQVVMQEV